ncbi:hypothetical protein PIB30_079241 [Stylosanthes scabra]|uniref:Uncharacterized protein n=1 Tax=Stylosanthes scabra TaxID=79078 RepID=A0ABU6YSX5_9FABA|nr:hypothetical protein [Stylosanthes scabra]
MMPRDTNILEMPFRYEAMWATYHNFKNTVRQNWQENLNLDKSLEQLSLNLAEWNKVDFGHVDRMKWRLINKIGGYAVSSSCAETRTVNLIDGTDLALSGIKRSKKVVNDAKEGLVELDVA